MTVTLKDRLDRLRAVEASLLQADPSDFESIRRHLAERETLLTALREESPPEENLLSAREAGERLYERLQLERARIVARLQELAQHRQLACALQGPERTMVNLEG